MAFFHQCDLGQNFTLGYKKINHISHSSKKLLENTGYPACDLSTCMAMLLHFDTLNQKSLQTEAAVQHGKIFQQLHK